MKITDALSKLDVPSILSPFGKNITSYEEFEKVKRGDAQ